MPKLKFLLAQKSAAYGIDGSELVYVSELVCAIKLAIKSAPDLNPKQAGEWLRRLRVSTSFICTCVGEEKTPADTLIREIVEAKDEICKRIKRTSSSTECSRHVTHLRLLLAFAKSMGFSHEVFAVEKEWEKLQFTGMDSSAQMIITDLKRNCVRPQDVTQKHLNDWKLERKNRECSFAATSQSISQLKYRIRQAGLQKSFPKLDVNSARSAPFRVAMKDMNPPVRIELEGILAWLAEQEASEILRMSERTRMAFAERTENLYGYAIHKHLPPLKNVVSLSDLFARNIVAGFARWGFGTGKSKQGTICVMLHSFHSVLKEHPSFRNQGWSWILDLINEFPQELESVIDARRQERAFDYDYDTLAAIPQMIREKRESAKDISDEEIGWMIHDELLILWLVTYPWPPRCLRECRIFGDHPNLMRGSDRIHLVSNKRRNPDIKDMVCSDKWFFRFDAEEVPKRRAVRGPVPLKLVPLLNLYHEYRPFLIRENDPGTLFLNRYGEELVSSTFILLVGDITERYVGKRIPPSAFRDIFSYDWLNKHRGDYLTVASIRWESVHGVRFHFDPQYRMLVKSKTRPRKRAT
jgi:hypothetical protein